MFFIQTKSYRVEVVTFFLNIEKCVLLHEYLVTKKYTDILEKTSLSKSEEP